MRTLIMISGMMLAGYMATAQTTWSFDKAHTNIEFSVQHLVISDVTGKFGSFDGKVVSEGDEFSGSDVSFTVDISSVDTGNEERDGHLKSDDFFNVEEYPKMSFSNGKLRQVDGKNYKLTGDLTIRDITKPVELDVKYGGTIKDPYGNTKAGFKVLGTINRFDYNMKFDAVMEAGGLVVGEEVDIVCNVELKRES